MGQSKLCVELNQLKDVSSTELGAGQPDGTATAERVELGATLVTPVLADIEVVIDVFDVVLDEVETALTAVSLVLVVFADVAATTVNEVVVLDFCCKEKLL